MPNSLEHYIQSYFGVPPGDLASITAFFKPLHLKKHDFYLKTDQYADRLGFVQTGLVREFFYHDGREVTKWISGPGYFVVDLASFLFDQPARWNLQALTDCEIAVIYKDDYARIGRTVPQWPVLEKMFLARCFTVLEDRVVNHLALSAEERHAAFFAFAPELFNQVPLHYLASMLGMTPETFSRIRKKQAGRSS